ncbi:MAG TPA: mechanosensitive ion channel domain-containing protein [Steroidobacteraceae bacterium]|jgi:small-conductance mechanosensitive channel|nr:mechanosensitive ion channel domain-containing protein [Steroidobacteraceae bacterium]
MQKPLQVISDALTTLQVPENALQAVLIVAAVALGWWAAKYVRARITVSPDPDNIPDRLRELLYVGAPQSLILAVLATLDGLMHAFGLKANMLDAAVQLVGVLLLIRVTVYVVRVSLGARTRLKGWGVPITAVIWVFVALHLLGWGDEVIAALDSIGLNAGKTRISVWSVLKLLVTVSFFVIAAMWASRWLERRVLKLDALAPTMRIGIAKFLQAFLVGLSVLVGLNAAGLDLTTLNVLTGAIGIGLGFGLQSIAANFVSGFVLLMDRSIKPGDVISFTGMPGTTTEGFGWVEELRGRYVVVRDRDGVEMLVPNQNLITNPVINWSYTDPRVRLKLPVRVSYKDDPELAMKLLLDATENHPRIIREPAPVARLMGFGDHGIELELRFWIPDPQEGVNNVRSDVNRMIWKLFREHGLTIPVAQREIRVEMGTSQVPAPISPQPRA